MSWTLAFQIAGLMVLGAILGVMLIQEMNKR